MFYTLWSKFLKMFGRLKVYPFPMWIVYNPKGYRMSDKDDKIVMKIIKKGDVLLRGYVDYLDTYFIPGKFSHVGLYVGDMEVIHSMQDGVFQEGLMRFLRCDYLAIMRPRLSEEEIDNVVTRARTLLGTPYDFLMDFEDASRMCCTEFVMCAFQAYQLRLGMKYTVKHFPFSSKMYQYIPPDAFLTYKGFENVFVNEYAKQKNIIS